MARRRSTYTEENRGDKQDAAGYKSPATTGRYDDDVPVVKATSQALVFSGNFSGGAEKARGNSLSACIYWWAHQDSNLEPRDYEAPHSRLKINDICVVFFPMQPRGTRVVARLRMPFFRRAARPSPPTLLSIDRELLQLSAASNPIRTAVADATWPARPRAPPPDTQ
ncbi:hypothetical protein [Stenotrophomonas maltophilia]|uniref:hypothetical protein n=1 Tax=Stenotrophomonas maltophilia TaxID=40324 RepID=UPI0012DB0025|nr:hypothetical protein [Stenotrophomonas maltophilia]